MHIIKLNAIDSTNDYLKELSAKKPIKDYTVVIAKTQLKGRGQMGTVWQSEKAMNLTCSIYKDCRQYSIADQFYFSMITSLAIVKTMKAFYIPKLVVKWPNDILSEQKKICGILIENVIKRDTIEASIIGVGLNVNQTIFDGLPNASSLKNLTGQLFSVEELMNNIVTNMKWYFRFLEAGKYHFLKNEYENILFRKNSASTFKLRSGELITGIIQSVTVNGSLRILLEDDVVNEYELKEIQLLF